MLWNKSVGYCGVYNGGSNLLFKNFKAKYFILSNNFPVACEYFIFLNISKLLNISFIGDLLLPGAFLLHKLIDVFAI